MKNHFHSLTRLYSLVLLVLVSSILSLSGCAEKETPEPDGEIIDAPINLVGYRNRVNETIQFRVTASTAGVIWGGEDNVYTDDSSVALAVIHAGKLQAGETGVVSILILPGRSSYPSVTRNGITSTAWNTSWLGSYQIL